MTSRFITKEEHKIDDLYYYMQFIKFGFGRCIRDVSRFIQNDHLTRKEGLEYVHKYDGEFPYMYFNEVLDYLDLKENELNKIIDLHRNQEIWKKNENNWELKFPLSKIYEEVLIEQVSV